MCYVVILLMLIYLQTLSFVGGISSANHKIVLGCKQYNEKGH